MDEQITALPLLSDAAYSAIAEAILFASGEPVPLSRIAEAMDISEELAALYIRRVADRYDESDGGLRVAKLGGCFQLTTRVEYAEYVKRALTIKKQAGLSGASVECLALIAYNQPVTKSFIERVRGIDSGSVVNTLVEKGLVEEYGRLDLPGKPIAYKTTENFLRCFGLSSITGLPPLEE